MLARLYGRTIEIDHLIPLELGGSNDIANLFPEPGFGTASYRVKDQLENRLHTDGLRPPDHTRCGSLRHRDQLGRAVPPRVSNGSLSHPRSNGVQVARCTMTSRGARPSDVA